MTIDLANACVGWEMHIYTVALLICVYRREEVQSCRVCKCTRRLRCAALFHRRRFSSCKKGFLARFAKIILFLLI